MSEMRSSWESLERRHRTEEIWEVFGVRAEVDLHGNSHLAAERFSSWRLGDEQATAETLAKSAKEGGLHAVASDEGIVISDQDGSSPADFTNRLHQWMLSVFEANPEVFLTRTARSISIPEKEHLPQSAAWLERCYGGENEFIPKEKKPLVADLNRSHGAYLSSVDDQPLVIMDAMSQIATLAGGFSPPQFQKALDEGEMDGAIVGSDWNGSVALTERRRFEAEVQQHLPDALCHFAYANSGAEANEKAYILARLYGPGGKRVLAFEGAFHGRTLLSLYSTWNKVKREPYQIKGYEVEFIPFPGFQGRTQPQVTNEWVSHWTSTEVRACPFRGEDDLMDREIECLEALRAALVKGDLCAVNLEPMQSEGGDNYGSARFFNGIRGLTRAFGVPLIMDEVQTGFGLGGTFFWHQQFQFRAADGSQDYPDLVICAKKAQVGVTISVWPDPFPTPCQAASAIRGRLHAEMGYRDHRSCEIHGLAEAGLAELEETMPAGLVSGGRCSGYAFALDLPSAAIADAMVAQRFYRGAMVYKAGAHTLRYRLSQAFNDVEVKAVFGVIRESLEAIIEWAGGVGDGGQELFDRMSAVKAPSWLAPAGENKTKGEKNAPSFSIRRITVGDFDSVADRIENIEERAYEPERRDDISFLRQIASFDDAVCLVAEADGVVVGFTFGAPLENFRHVQGPDSDVEKDKGTTFYSADVTVDPEWQGHGIGGQLKAAQIRAVLGHKTDSGASRYQFVTGRNRVGHTAEMSSINSRFGAYTVALYTGQYGDSDGVAQYYRIPLRRPSRALRIGNDFNGINLESGLLEPLDPSDEGIRTALSRGCFDGAMLSKMTLSNFTTPNVIRYVELMKEVRPSGTDHMYMTSCRDEMVDKAIRTLRSHRPEGSVCISFSNAFVGHTTAAARSISDWDGIPFGERMGWFDWPRISHPGAGPEAGDENHENCWSSMDHSTVLKDVDSIKAYVKSLGISNTQLQGHLIAEGLSLHGLWDEITKVGANHVIGVFAESIQERTGHTFSDRMWKGLAAILEHFDVPLVMDETTSGMGRTGRSLWRSSSLPIQADVVLFYGGGQLGHVFVTDRYFLAKPLQLISTWDGDEVSTLRLAWLLRALRKGDHQETAQMFEQSVREALESKGIQVNGEGFYLAFEVPNGGGEQIRSALRSRGIHVGKSARGHLICAPALTTLHSEKIDQVTTALRAVL